MPLKTSIELTSPGELRPHPLKKLIPVPAAWQKGGEDFNRLLEDIRERGIQTPLLVNTMGEVLDGEVRRQIAKILHLEVPTLTLVCREAASVILGGLLQRQHLSKSTLAYMSYPLFEKAHTEARSRRLENLRKGQQIPEAHSVGDGNSVVAICEKMGVSKTFFDYAARLHAAFAKNDILRAAWEPKILAGEVALGPALAGIAGGATGGPRKGDQLELFKDGFNTVALRFTYWQKFDEVTREAARATIHQTVAAMPEDLRGEFEHAIRLARKNERKAA